MSPRSSFFIALHLQMFTPPSRWDRTMDSDDQQTLRKVLRKSYFAPKKVTETVLWDTMLHKSNFRTVLRDSNVEYQKLK